MTKQQKMKLEIKKFKFGERESVTIPNPLFYKTVGEEEIRKMVSRHYELLRISEIKHLFPTNNVDLEHSKRNAADFMIQICGGPDYFNQHRGNPMMAKRHAPFTITPEARIVWLDCYRIALSEVTAPEELVISFWNYLNIFSNWMVNSDQ